MAELTIHTGYNNNKIGAPRITRYFCGNFIFERYIFPDHIGDRGETRVIHIDASEEARRLCEARDHLFLWGESP